ncbi:uncharacterized protein LOC135831331 isoform X2 [Planococcus citri]
MNHNPTGSSGARISYGRAAIPFETSFGPNNASTEAPIKSENHSSTVTQQNSTSYETIGSSTDSSQLNTATTFPSSSYSTTESDLYRVKSISSSTSTPVTPNEGRSSTFEYASTSPTYPNEDIVRDNVYNQPQTIDTIAPILLAQQPSSDDTYLQPEINEISNGFIGNIVSMLPTIIATRSKLLKPIIVSNSSNTKREITPSENSTKEIDGKTDLATDSTQSEEYHEVPEEQVISAGGDNDTLDETHPKYLASSPTEVDIKKPHVDVVIEPQMLEEQAVITTTVDIAKSLPLAVNFIPENDNRLNDVPLNFIPTPSQFVLPQNNVYLQQPVEQPVVALQLPQAVLKPDNIPQPYLLPNSEFHYIPIPVLQHQPNVIPLNYVNDNRTSPDTAESVHIEGIRPSQEYQQPQETAPKTDYSFVKSIEDHLPNQYNVKPYDLPRKLYNKPSHHLQQFDQRRQVLPYTTINLPAAQLVPYVKHNFIQQSPGYYSPHQQKLPPPSASPKSHTIPYNLAKSYPKEKRTPQQKAPFKPSHPVWDSVYPPSHMYYVPLVVVDRVPGERNPKDSFSRRHHHLRRLYVEYGGFKPPLIPSTLIETEEPAQEKRDIPKEAGTES